MEPAASPFLPDSKIQWIWDSTSLGWFKECPKKYEYYMIRGLVPKGDSVHLKFGILYHSSLEAYDKARAEGKDHEEATRAAVWKALIDSYGWVSDHPAKNRENLIRSVIWYVEQFQDDPAQTVILADGKPAVELTFKMELDFGPSKSSGFKVAEGVDTKGISLKPGAVNYSVSTPVPTYSNYVLSGHIDRLVNFMGGVYVTDRKTSGSTLYQGYFDQYTPHNQMSLYSVAAKVIWSTPVKGVLIDAVQIAVGFSRFSRGFAYRTDAMLEEWLEDTKHILRYAEHCATDNYWPRNDTACHKFGGCPFRKICSRDDSVREVFLASDYEHRPWNPLQVR